MLFDFVGHKIGQGTVEMSCFCHNICNFSWEDSTVSDNSDKGLESSEVSLTHIFSI